MRVWLILLFIIPNSLYSQSLGIKGGINFSKTKIDTKFDYNNDRLIVLPSFGVVLHPGISDKFDVGFEPTFSKYGYRQIWAIYDGGIKRGVKINKIKINYLELPVSFNLFPIHKSAILGLHVGFAPMFLLGTHSETRYKVNDVVACTFAGIVLGYNVTEKTSLRLTGRYQFSLSDVYALVDSKINSFNIFTSINYKF